MLLQCSGLIQLTDQAILRHGILLKHFLKLTRELSPRSPVDREFLRPLVSLMQRMTGMRAATEAIKKRTECPDWAADCF